MYEEITYDLIMKRMLNRVLESNPGLDVREGSIIYSALAPAAVELQNMYIQLDTILLETFADTASRDYLIKRCAERGIEPYPATYAIRKGEFNIDIPTGSRFSLNKLNYTAIERIGSGTYRMQCETPGEVGNAESGNLIPIEYIDGLTSAKLTDIIIPGEDEEDTEALRTRYFNSLESEAYGGNITDYKEKVGALDGVGGVKVYPTPNGVGGTVKLVIIGANGASPSVELVQSVQTAVDPTQNQGNGLGIAPIGHVVTVEGVKNTSISIEVKIGYQTEYNWESVKDGVEAAISEYLHELAMEWAENETIIVRISQIETRILNCVGVLDVSDARINNVASNLELDADAIPVLQGVSEIV